MSFASQISNRNFLSPGGFRFSLGKFPKVSYLAQSANIPEINMGLVQQDTPFRPAYIDGTLEYGSFNLQFLVDEDLENYLILHNWMRGLGFPESPQQFIDKTTDSDGIRDLEEQYCDGGLHILSSNLRDVAIVKFQNLFPVSLTSLNFDATETDINYFTASASFRYTVYNITNTSGNLL